MKIPIEFYNQLRHSIRISDIVKQSIVLTRKGNEYLGKCPFHNEKTPSFTVNDIKKFYHCFGCSAHGDVIKFVSEIFGISYKEAAIKIANEHGIKLPKISPEQEKIYEEEDRIYDILRLATEFFIQNLDYPTKKYLTTRGVTMDSTNHFSLGFAPGGGSLEKFFQNKSIPLKDLLKSGLFGKKDDGRVYEVFNQRIIFPIKNIYNKVVGFGGRTIGNNMPKYINSPETIVFKKSELMYGENIAISHAYKDNYSIIVEGYLDVIALHQSNFKHVVASLGTSVTNGHIKKLWNAADEIIFCLDGDNAGLRASQRVVNMTLPQISSEKKISFIELPQGMDPDDLIKAKGASSFKSLLEQRISLSEMLWKMEFQDKDFNTAEDRSLLESTLKGYSALVQDRLLSNNFNRYFQDMIWKNLIRKKNKHLTTIKNSKKLLDSKHYSEIDYIEKSICLFMIKFPKITQNYDYKIEFTNKALNEFMVWINDLAKEAADISEQTITDKVKNTRFYNHFLILSDVSSSFLDNVFSSDKMISHGQVFEWLSKKHYLLLLKKEYVDILNRNAYGEQSRTVSYLEEIRRATQEINTLSLNLIES